MSPDGSAPPGLEGGVDGGDEDEDEDDADDRGLDELLRSGVDGSVRVPAVAPGPAAVVLSPSLPTSSQAATPTAASTTIPATTSAISVLRFPFGCRPPGPPGPPGGPHCGPGWPYGP
jgi:hypothetical protein